MHALERRLGRGQVRAGGEDADDVSARALERPVRLLAGLDRPLRGSGPVDSPSRCARSRAGRYSAPRPLPRLPAGIFGPTGVGKTALAFALADGCARRRAAGGGVGRRAAGLPGPRDAHRRPVAAERARLEHRLVSILPVDARFSVGEYAALAHAEIDGLFAQGARPIVVGGTGLYLRAALAELDLRPARPTRCARAGSPSSTQRGPEALHAELARRAPRAARVGRPARSQPHRAPARAPRAGRARAAAGPNQLWTSETRHPTRLVGLVMDRDALYARIDARVDAMVAAGVHARSAPPTRRAPRRPRARRWASRSCWPATSRR